MTKREIDPDSRISPHFTWREFLRSRTASRLGLRNVIYRDSPEQHSAEALFQHVIEPVRVSVAHPLFITSGFRCAELNRAVGGVPGSEHQLARAADLASGQLDSIDLAQAFVDQSVPFNQLILEYDQDVVHVSHGPENKGEVLTRFMRANAIEYTMGLIPEGEL